MSDIRRMQLGQIVDFVIAYNERQKGSEKAKNTVHKRRATQADIDAFLG